MNVFRRRARTPRGPRVARWDRPLPDFASLHPGYSAVGWAKARARRAINFHGAAIARRAHASFFLRGVRVGTARIRMHHLLKRRILRAFAHPAEQSLLQRAAERHR